MSTPDQPPPLPEAGRPPVASEIRECLAFLRPHAMEPDAAAEIFDRLPVTDLHLYESITDRFREGSGWSELFTEGSYPRLRQYAKETAHDLVGDYQGEMTLPRAFGVHALASLDAVAFRPFNEVESDDRTTFFLVHLARKLSLALPHHVVFGDVSPVQFAHVMGSHSGIKALANRHAENSEWLGRKFVSLGESMAIRRHVGNITDREPKVEVDDAKELRQNNNVLFAELTRLRRYSIKSAIHEGEKSSWSIHDTYNIKLDAAAVVEAAGSGIHVDRWSSMVMEAIEQPVEDKRLVRTEHNTDGDSTILDQMYYFGRHVFMDDKGELFADMEGAMPLWDFYKAAGKPNNYESLRQFLLQKYFDLTVPLEIVREAVQSTKTMLGSRNPDVDREHGQVQYDLLLPRIRVLMKYRRPEDLEEVENREVKQYPYPRVGHATKLPPGYKTSDDARRYAAEAGVSLKEGETYTRPYTPPPEIAKPLVHRAKKRRPKPFTPDNETGSTDSK